MSTPTPSQQPSGHITHTPPSQPVRGFASVLSGALIGFDGALVEVQADIKAGLPGLQIVGMGNKAIDEARLRVRSAITNTHLTFPAQKVTVNLAPAELPKDGTHLDVPVALSILVATRQLLPSEVKDALFAGELALDGSLRPIRGAVLLAELAQKAGLRFLYLPQANVAQAALVNTITIIGVATLTELYQRLKGVYSAPGRANHKITTAGNLAAAASDSPSLDTIIGHQQAKRALIIAASGRHNLLLSGPPGTGKTLLAKSLPGILPPLTGTEIVEVTKLHSLAGGARSTNDQVITQPPFRSPHHSATLTSLIGGGLRPQPGDISLAHKGVLFLDELPEYSRPALEALRQPLEDRSVHLSRLYGRISYPADILLIATMNPCPCGYLGDTRTACSCSLAQISSYKKRISGPLLDRIDLRVTVSKTNNEQFFDTISSSKKQHSKVLSAVLNAREQQMNRYSRSDFYNSYASLDDIRRLFNVQPPAQALLNNANKRLALSSRSYVRILRVARTIADLDASSVVHESHIAEALQFR